MNGSPIPHLLTSVSWDRNNTQYVEVFHQSLLQYINITAEQWQEIAKLSLEKTVVQFVPLFPT